MQSPILQITDLIKCFPARNSRDKAGAVTALDGVSLSVRAGKTLAIAGESGSGKSTLALCLACLERPTSGTIYFDGREVSRLRERELRGVRPQMQLVFQDPVASLNPRLTAFEIVSEPLIVQHRGSPNERVARVESLLKSVGLSQDMARRKPNEFSGGQRQRLAIARALALEPKVLILDEALSALDVSVQAQIANLLLELQQSLRLTYVFITHDLAMAAFLADEIAVLDRGKVVEYGSVRSTLGRPSHMVTKTLLAAVPRLPVTRSLAELLPLSRES